MTDSINFRGSPLSFTPPAEGNPKNYGKFFGSNGVVTSCEGEVPKLLKEQSKQVMIAKLVTLVAGGVFIGLTAMTLCSGLHGLTLNSTVAGLAGGVTVFAARRATIYHREHDKEMQTLGKALAKHNGLDYMDMSQVEYGWKDFKQEVRDCSAQSWSHIVNLTRNPISEDRS